MPPPLTIAAWLRDVQKRLEKATPGEWEAEGNGLWILEQDGWDRGKPIMVNRMSVSVQSRGRRLDAEEVANAALFAHSTADLRRLLALVQFYKDVLKDMAPKATEKYTRELGEHPVTELDVGGRPREEP